MALVEEFEGPDWAQWIAQNGPGTPERSIIPLIQLVVLQKATEDNISKH